MKLKAGLNIIQFGNPRSYPPDLDRIVISGDGSAPRPTSTTYEAELATLAGTASASYCQYCLGGSEAGNLGGGSGYTVTFTNVTVAESGTYQMEIDYLTSGPRSFFMSVNDTANIELDLNVSSFSLPTSTVIPVELKAGSNTIRFGNATGYAPALERIAISPTVGSVNLTASTTGKVGGSDLRVWKLTLSNFGTRRADRTQINIFR